mmetsp:Transcript_4943/g.9272  ORF Transcript_4943/g.9272 Transcript_4943/m.9272 type:complete len:130 (+) Transcript_4943:418-807(+)
MRQQFRETEGGMLRKRTSTHPVLECPEDFSADDPTDDWTGNTEEHERRNEKLQAAAKKRANELKNAPRVRRKTRDDEPVTWCSLCPLFTTILLFVVTIPGIVYPKYNWARRIEWIWDEVGAVEDTLFRY